MDDTRHHLKIKIGGRELSLSCAPGERENLENAAKILNNEISNIQKSSHTNSISLEASAIIAALNLAAELIEIKQNAAQHDFNKLIDEIDTTLAN